MTHFPDPPIPVWKNSVYWLGCRTEGAFVQHNSYCLLTDSSFYVIDPGSAVSWRCIKPVLEELCREREEMNGVPWSIVLTGSDATVSGCLLDGSCDLRINGREPDFIYAHWKAVLLLQVHPERTVSLSSYKPGVDLGDGRKLTMLPLVEGERSGNCMFAENGSGVIFTGAAFSSSGPRSWKDENDKVHFVVSDPNRSQLGALYAYQSQFCDPQWIESLVQPEHAFWKQRIHLLLPRAGMLISGSFAGITSALHSRIARLPRNLSEPSLESGQKVEELMSEIHSLQANTFELQESMVVMQDERIRDPATSLYNRRFYTEYMPMFCEDHAENAALIYVYLDGLDLLNRELGSEEGDFTMSRFAEVLQLNKPKNSMLFRLAGPLCALLTGSLSQKEAEQAAIRIKQAVRDETGFPRRMSCSVAVATVENVGDIRQLETAAEIRLKYVRRQGGNAVCSDNPVEQGNDLAAFRVLLLETDSLTSRLISSFLNTQGCVCRTTLSAVDALSMLVEFRPAVVISELFLHGSDALRVREQALADSALREIPWIVYSYQKNDQAIQRAHGLGIFHFLRKPIVLNELLGLVRHLTGRNDEGGGRSSGGLS
ncbi:GGDEF domain-containing response regulator [Spirochaeta dissipatitropha]